MATTNETIDININGSQALASLRNIERSVDTLANGFKDFMTGVAEGMSDALKSTNKTKAGIDAMKKSMDGLGAATDKADIGKKLSAQTAQAAKGTNELSKTLSGVSNKFINFEGIVGGLVLGNFIKNTYQAAEGLISFSSANNSAARASASVSANVSDLQQGFLNAMQPINDFVAELRIGVDAATEFWKWIKAIVIALASFFVITRVISWVAKLSAGLASMASAMGAAGQTSARFGLAWNNFVNAIRTGGGTVGGTFKAIEDGAVKMTSSFMNKASTMADGPMKTLLINRAAALGDGIIKVGNSVAAGLLAIFGVSTVAFVRYFDDIKKMAADTATSIIMTLANAGMLRKHPSAPDFKPTKDPYPGLGMFSDPSQVAKMDALRKMEIAGYEATNAALTEQENLRRQLGKQLAQDLQNLRLQNAATVQQLQLETQLVGKTEQQAEIARAVFQLEQQRAQLVAQLRGRIAMGEDPKLLGGQIAAVNRLYEEQKNRITEAVQKLQDAKLLEQDRLNTLQRITAEYERQQNINQTMGNVFGGLAGQQAGMNFERSLMGKGAGVKDLLTKRRDLNLQYAQAAGQLIEAFSVDGEITDVKRYSDAVKQLDNTFEKLHKTLNDNTAAQNRWSTGWQEAWANFRETINNEALTAQQQFDAVIGNMMSALDNFVKTGKLNFKDLVASIIRDLTALALKRAIFNALDIGGWGGFFGKLIGAGASMLTGGAYVGPASAGGRATAASAPIVNNYYSVSAIDSRSVAQFFSEHRRTVYGTVMQAEKESPTRARFR